MKNYIQFGIDTETCDGKPFSIQLYSESTEVIIWVNEKTSSRKFLEYCDSLPDGNYIFWCHNLEYDLVSLFFDRHILFKNDEFSFDQGNWNVKGVFHSVVFCDMSSKNGRKTIHIRDTFAYYKTSLAKLAETFCPKLPKLNRPDGLGDKIFTKDDKEFCEYAMRDSVIAYHVGNYLFERHMEYNIPLTVSAPHYSAQVFRTKYMEKDIPLPSKGKIYSSLLSYHGGKNNTTVPYGWYENVKLVDVISAYPAAMYELPSFYDRERYITIEQSSGNTFSLDDNLPRYGVYRISGIAKPCKWPVLFDSAFEPLSGEFTDVWVTGPELNEALRSREVEITKCFGYFYDADNDKNESPFRKFVDDFYSKKEASELEPTSRAFAKLILNSLYGKFIQSRGSKDHLSYYYDLDNFRLNKEKVIIAGGLFHPFIATLITGIVRAKMHKLEHKYAALHTATDGIFTTAKNIQEKPGLGGLKIEAKGDLLLFRNKLYILYTRNKTKIPSKVFKDRYIAKFALHGFRGTVWDLEKIYVSGDPTYTYKKVNKLRESLRRNLAVNKFEKLQGTLNIENEDDDE